METAGAVSSALILLLHAAKKLEHLWLRAPISMHMPAVSTIRHLTLAVWQLHNGVVIFGCMTQWACSSLAALPNLETLTLTGESMEGWQDIEEFTGSLDLKALHLRSLYLNGVSIYAVEMPSLCKLHAESDWEDGVLCDPDDITARLVSIVTSVGYRYGRDQLRASLQHCACLSYLELGVDVDAECARLELGDALPHVRILKLSGMNVHVVLGATPQLQVLWASARRRLDLECLQPTALASSLQYVRLEFETMQCVLLLVALKSMAAAGKDWSASQSQYSGVQSRAGTMITWQQVIGRYPGGSWCQMEQLFCHCSICMHKDIDSKIEDCSKPCGVTRRKAAGQSHAAGFYASGP